jgi:hypothetical protein
MKGVDWLQIIATVCLTSWGMLGIYSSIRNDNKSRFFTMVGFGDLFDKGEDQRTITRAKNFFLGILCTALGLGLLYVQFKK